jgi:hypothetical protein
MVRAKLQILNADFKNKSENWLTNRSVTVSYGLLIGTALGLVFYLLHFDPVNYTIFLISEDQWGEYFTSINYALSSVLLIALSLKPARYSQKIMWVMMGLATFFIGAEEISWGQRIFGLSIPSIASQSNVQGEFNFHNIRYINELDYHDFAACFILGWSFFSVAVSLWFPRLKHTIQNFGLPLIPLRLVLIFLTVSYLFLFYPVVKSDEIGELFLSIAVVIWASDLFMQHSFMRRIGGLRAVIAVCGILFFVAILSVGMTYKFPGWLGWRLNNTASRDYPSYQLYDQAESIYEYIYSHPKYLTPETRINHARMLLELNNKNKALSILSTAVKEFETNNPPEKKLSNHLRLFGTVLTLLEHSDRADAKFKQAIKVDEQQIKSTPDQETKAKLLWSIAKTLAAEADVSAAIDKAQQARSVSNSAQMHQDLDKWIKDLREMNRHQYSL